jgi:hypothetical protein
MEKKRKRKESKWEKTKERKGKEEGKEVLTRPWHTFLAVSFKIIPLIVFVFFLGMNPKKKSKATNRGKEVEKENRLKEVF